MPSRISSNSDSQAKSINGVPIADIEPVSSQLLGYDGIVWKPTNRPTDSTKIYETPPDVLPNLVLGKASNASSNPGDVHYALDGPANYYEEWVSGPFSGAEWIEVNLAGLCRVSRWVCQNETTIGDQPNANNVDYSFQVWDSIIDTYVDADSVTGNHAAFTDRTITPVDTTKVRLYITNPGTWFDNVARVTGFLVYGYHLVEVQPASINGDLSSSSGSTIVTGLQSIPVSDTTPNEGQILGFTTNHWGPIDAPTGGTNTVTGYTLVSEGANASADSAAGGYPASLAFDGDTTTGENRWISANTAVSHWLKADLGTEVLVGKWWIMFESDVDSDYNARDFEIQYSLDNTSWTAVSTVTGNSATIRQATFTPVLARYWRIYITVPNSGTVFVDTARSREFRLYRANTGSGDVDAAAVNVAKTWEVVSFGAVVLYESQNASYPASNLVDNSDTTRWVNNNGSTPTWATIDLGAPLPISKIRVVNEVGDTGGDYFTRNFKVRSSDDNATWTDRTVVTGNTILTVDRIFIEATARYWQLYVTTPNQGTGAANGDFSVRIYRFDLYQEKITGVSLIALNPSPAGDFNFGTVDQYGRVVNAQNVPNQFQGVSVYANASQNLPPATYALLFDSELYDTTAYHNTGSNTSRLTVPTGKAGYYRITGMVRYTFNGGGGTRREAYIRLNGTTNICEIEVIASNSSYNSLNPTVTYHLAESDYVELVTYHDASGDIPSYTSPAPFLQMDYIGA